MMIIEKSKVDIIGTISSVSCAVHCLAFPVLLSLGIIGGAHTILHDRIELLVIIASITLAALSVRQAVKRSYDKTVQLIFAFGVGILIMSFLFIDTYTHQFMALGGLSIALGHLLNYRSFKKIRVTV